MIAIIIRFARGIVFDKACLKRKYITLDDNDLAAQETKDKDFHIANLNKCSRVVVSLYMTKVFCWHCYLMQMIEWILKNFKICK